MIFCSTLPFVIVFLWSTSLKVSAGSNRCDVRRPVRYWSKCEECSINERLRCPAPFIHTSSGIGVRGCPLRIYFGSSIGAVNVLGCKHTCDRMENTKECCSGYWGSNCQACPGNPACSSAGKCFDKVKGNGTCLCRDGSFHGTACEMCTNTTMFGPTCDRLCGCQRGVCQNIVRSTGQCKPYSCQIGYVGVNCSIRLPACRHSKQCEPNADCFNLNGTDTCVCEPGYSRNGSTCVAINPCRDNSHGCHRNANCIYTAPGKHRCECARGYRGDGTVCVVIDPCQTNNGGCGPNNSTVCNLLGPGRTNCTCLPGFANKTNSAGCSVINLCDDGNRGGCDVNAECFMPRPGEKRCSCKKGFRGNGAICYDNIAKRLVQLNLNGPPGVKGLLNNTISILTHSLARPLADTGPFTVFVSIDTAIGSLSPSQRQLLLSNNTDFLSQLVLLHVIAADLDSVALKRIQNVITLQGTEARIGIENGTMSYSLAGSSTKAQIIALDLLAGNGIIHVVNKVLWYPGNYTSTHTLTVLEIIQRQKKYEQFSRLLELSGVTSYLTGVSGVTVLVPDNSPFLKLDNVTVAYLTTTAEGKAKLGSLLKYHIIQTKASLQITDLMSLHRVTSIEGESSTVQLTPQGGILFNGKARVIESNILARDGIIHRISDLLIPDHILPLLPNFVYTYKNTSVGAACYRCDSIPNFPNKGCPSGYNPSTRYVSCRFTISTPRGQYSFAGCKVSDCIKTIKIKDCSSGFYGSTCRPCPGPVGHPCNLHGTCQDKIGGSGICTCQALFTGTACEKCAISNSFGSSCNKTCTCVNGLCDGGISGSGTCKPNSCTVGYHGDNCDVTDVSCAHSSRRCHIHSSCVTKNGTDVCKCNPGYEGSGVFCTEINLCTKPNRGGCHKDAFCTKTGPGTNNCACGRGFRGDGVVCVVVDPCKEVAQLSCHSNAECRFIGPGQSLCVCKAGYTGSGQTCTEINNCLVNNGGCSSKAKCYRVSPGQHNCTCSYGYIGNGYSCIGSVAKVIQDNKHLTSLYNFIKKAHLEYFLSMKEMNFTVFAPSNEAIQTFNLGDSKYWSQSNDRLVYLIQYHLANVSYSSSILINLMSLIVMNGQTLNISRHNNTVILNGKAQVTQADIGAANGMVHIIDKVLVPERLLAEPILLNVSQVLANLTEFSDLNQLLQSTHLRAELDKCVGCTIFAPINSALQDYRLVQHKNITLDVLKYHVILKYISTGHFYDGQQYSTKLGQNYLVKLTKSEAGRFEINGIPFNTIGIRTKFSIVYKLSKVLEPTKSRCDVYFTKHGVTACRWCAFTVKCPSPWTHVRSRSCTFWGFLRGCQSLCKQVHKIPKCCSGFWGADCQACPGDVKSACYGHGNCTDGVSGTGHCGCSANFTGTACEKCLPNRYGKNCSSMCACSVHGCCNDGINGDGSCRCNHGWKGPRCNKSANLANCHPVTCNTHATCRESNGAHKCECDFGYLGNGTYCREVHACDIYSGGCHSDATCMPHPEDSSRALCTCKKGYTGDGTFCSGINLCQRNNGGCHANATCSSTGPGKRTCHCNNGFLGDGITSCKSDNPCLENRGECSLRATCTQTGPGQRKCTCGANYVGNGETCIGSSMEILGSDPELSKLDKLYETHKLDKLLHSNTAASILAPTNEAMKRIQRKRKRRSVPASPTIQQYLRYHIIGCARITNQTLLTGGRFVSLLGPPIWLKNNGSHIFFMDAQNNTAKVTNIFKSANGYVFKMDTLLTPPADVANTGNPSSSYVNVAKSLGHTTSLDLQKRAGLENLFSNPFGRPYLVFSTTNQAIEKLPSRLKTRLTTPAHVDELREYIKYHVVANAPANLTTDFFVRGGGGGVELTTLQGNTIFVSCKGGKGDLYVNGMSRISKRDIQFDGGVIFVVDYVILPLGLGGNCDQPVKDIFNGSCGNCLVPVSCPAETTLVGATRNNCTFDGGILGCQPVCMRHKVQRKCCSNFYGSDCRACPGDIGTPCFGRGQCDDGLTGTGTCNCTKLFYGTACERCPNNTYCPVPGSCSENVDACHVYATCSDESGRVNCTCRPGYEGDGVYCQMIDLCAINNGDCGVNATCHFQGPNKRRCQCKPGFQEVNYRCEPFEQSSPCSVNHGGCSRHAGCTKSNGAAVCTCWQGYTGNGIICHGNLIQSLEDTVKASAFYQVLHHLRMSGDGQVLFTDLQLDSKEFTVFAPINSAVQVKGFNLTLVKNHIVPRKIKLSTLSTVTTVKNLLGTKLMIRKAANGDISINGAAHVLTDVQATNGVIFVVDQAIPISGSIPHRPVTTPRPTTTTRPTTLSSSSPQQTTVSTKPATQEPATQEPATQEPATQEPATQEPLSPTNNTKPGESGRLTKRHEKLTEGEVAGIVICILFMIAAVSGVIWCLRKKGSLPSPSFRYRKENETVQYDSEAFQDGVPNENPTYNGDTSVPGPSEIVIREESGFPVPFSESGFRNPLYFELKEPQKKDNSSHKTLTQMEDAQFFPGEEQKC